MSAVLWLAVETLDVDLPDFEADKRGRLGSREDEARAARAGPGWASLEGGADQWAKLAIACDVCYSRF